MTTSELLGEIDVRIQELEEKKTKTQNSIHVLRSVRDLASGHSNSFADTADCPDEESCSGDPCDVLLERVVAIEERILARKGRRQQTLDRIFLRRVVLQRQGV